MIVGRGALLESNFESKMSRGPTPALHPALVYFNCRAVYSLRVACKVLSAAPIHTASPRLHYRFCSVSAINSPTVQLQPAIPDPLVNALREARAVVVLTGAGVSAESGIPTFRDAMEGLWAKFDPGQLATPGAFARDPEMVSRWYDWRREKCAAAKPNPAHLALARFEKHFAKQKLGFTLLTQNVDRLHQAAGSDNVVELHGTLWVWRCTQCGVEREERAAPFKEYPPRCSCGGTRRPAVVWFGETLPEPALEQARDALEACDFFFSIGTSAAVEPAASFIHTARHHGAKTGEINRDATSISGVVNWSLRGKAGEILPELVGQAFGV